jgi:DNA-binding transcriptional ArsR family regulator
VIDAHAPEMPTRFAKQLTQVVRGGVAIGLDRAEALRLAIRCARDSMPPLRLAIIDALAAVPHRTATDVRRRLDKPRATVDRQMQALHMLGVLEVEELEDKIAGRSVTRWYYSLAEGIDPKALDPDSLPEMLTPPHSPSSETHGGYHISGNGAPASAAPAEALLTDLLGAQRISQERKTA